jgi:hypothetical protein
VRQRDPVHALMTPSFGFGATINPSARGSFVALLP